MRLRVGGHRQRGADRAGPGREHLGRGRLPARDVQARPARRRRRASRRSGRGRRPAGPAGSAGRRATGCTDQVPRVSSSSPSDGPPTVSTASPRADRALVEVRRAGQAGRVAGPGQHQPQPGHAERAQPGQRVGQVHGAGLAGQAEHPVRRVPRAADLVGRVVRADRAGQRRAAPGSQPTRARQLSHAGQGRSVAARIGWRVMSDVLHFSQVSVLRDGATLVDRLGLGRSPRASAGSCSGPNGAGKTTLLQLASANLHPSRGTATILGETARRGRRVRAAAADRALQRCAGRAAAGPRDRARRGAHRVVRRGRPVAGGLRATWTPTAPTSCSRRSAWPTWPSAGSGRCRRASASGCRSPGR